ncbi:hypothetical protein AKJ65_08145 [candidate division MSBL1 archaeon SCGC-AAA259E19]|uniref:Uncharacterized protein n=1 Tax=candidate division MSBL1 archaeon SCGC-AAA259E19 TaxID=1698264 RepID=A0A133UCY3_9EURY|nr:hypothetical protein AKJ65_08145 [candidate division MSBL1 archaeon SCGC-AAA259E19]
MPTTKSIIPAPNRTCPRGQKFQISDEIMNKNPIKNKISPTSFILSLILFLFGNKMSGEVCEAAISVFSGSDPSEEEQNIGRRSL